MSLFITRFPVYVYGLFDFPPVPVLCSLIVDRGWQHDRCSVIRVPSGLVVFPM